MPSNTLTKKHTTPLYEIYKQITNYKNNFIKEKVINIKRIKEKMFSNEELTNIPSFSNYIETIQQTLLNMDKYLFQCTFTIHERSFHIHLVTTTIDIDFVINTFQKVYTLLNILVPFSKEKCSRTLSMYLFMSPAIKLLPSKSSQILDQTNVNTAFTYACKHDNEIHIFRQEEWFKVLIHECFHSFGLDFASVDSGYSDQFSRQIFHVNTDFRLYESYCETWATIINCVFHVENEQKSLNITLFKNELEKCIKQEIKHSLFQCSKLLYYFGLKYSDFYEENDTAAFARRNKYKEETPVISYFFFKTICLFYYPEFIQWCLQNNTPFLTFLNYTEDMQSKIQKYAFFIQSKSQDSVFLQQINKESTTFNKKVKHIHPNEIYDYQNIRMTYYS
tara:strand:- start:15307 stop:16479 length:1173 start_codon:yes stop_codon:yes gene_type:complete